MEFAMRHWTKALGMLAIIGMIASISTIGSEGVVIDRSSADIGLTVEGVGGIDILRAIAHGMISNPRDLKVRSFDNSAQLTWSAPLHLNGSTLIGYIIQRSIDGGPWGNLTMVDGKTTRFTDSWISNGMVVIYRILAVGESGWSDPSNEASAKPVGIPWPPNNIIVRVDGSFIIIGWDEPLYDGGSAVGSYAIYRKSDLDKEFTRIAEVPASERSWIDETASGNRTVRYYIIAENIAGWSGQSSISSVSDVPFDEAHIGSSGNGLWYYTVGGILIAGTIIGSSAIWIRRRKSSPKTMAPMPIPYQAQCVQASYVGACP